MWLYKGEPVDKISEGNIGFVYEIVCPTGHFYLGRKLCISNRKKIIKGKNKRVLVETDWKTYCGSSADIKLLVKTYGLDKFKREILHWCKDKSSMAYLEAKELFGRDALLKDEYLNRWITMRINGKNLKSLRKPLISKEEWDRYSLGANHMADEICKLEDTRILKELKDIINE